VIPAKTPQPLPYRPDIDGLRAIAVLAVVFFHVDAHRLRGGFIGVDIFFVISGYLISSHIINSMKTSSFSFVDFYARRVNRIFPAFLLVISTFLAFGWFALFDDEFKQMGEAAVSGLLFYPNILLYRQVGYFDGASELKPFLHFWSLGVEEQFYFLWPILLLLTFKKWRTKTLVIVVAGCSFAISMALVAYQREAAFYLPFGRFWELLTGAYLAAHGNEQHTERSRNEWLTPDRKSVVGLFLVLLSLFVISRRLQYFPGLWVALPVLGAALMISAGADAIINRRLLAHPVAVFIGLISYPLYLWHWPLLYAANALSRGAPTIVLKLIAVMLAGALSYLTYRFVELPTRRRAAVEKGRVAARLVGCAAVATSFSFVAACLGNTNLRGDAFTLGKNLSALTTQECGLSKQEKAVVTWCLSDAAAPANLVVFGDSNAHAIFPGLLSAAPPKYHWSLIANAGCGPFLGVRFKDPAMTAETRAKCERFVDSGVRAIIANPLVKTVLLAMKRTLPADPNYELTDARPLYMEPVEAGLYKTIKALQDAGKEVILLVHNPDITGTPEFCAPRPLDLHVLVKKPVCSMPRQAYDSETAHMRKVFASLQAKLPKLRVFDPANILCSSDACNVFSGANSLYSYTTHLSDHGNKAVAEAFYRWIIGRDAGIFNPEAL
jgi:peptidoglycan/LPS O-acetylase OafA/YrhL